MKFVSLCVLAYKRPELLERCLKSIKKTADFPYELIINFDGLESWQAQVVTEASKLIFNNGKNRGVGRSFQNCLGLAEGDYIFKVDSDIIFTKPWLKKAVSILNSPASIGALGLYDYNTQDPNDDRFKPKNNILREIKDAYIVKDFVSSIYGFKKEALDVFPFTGEDDGFHQTLSHYGHLALMKETVLANEAWGVTKSTYVSGTEDNPFKTPTYNEPLIFNA